MIRISDTIPGPTRGSEYAFWQWLTAADKRDDTEAVHYVRDLYEPTNLGSYIRESFRLAPLVGMDPAILVAQSAHETDNWRSPAWVKWLNPAGLGITYSGQDPGYRWQDGTDAARAQIVHMVAYVYGDEMFTSPLSMPSPISEYTHLDPRLHAVFAAKLDGTVRTIADLTGKWATDPRYAEKIAAKGNAIFPDLPNQQEEPMADITYGNVERPAIIPMICAKPYDGAGFTRVSPRQNVGACDHITDGDASLEWYHDFFATGGQRQYDALTDYGIDKAGRIAMWNDPDGTRSPWASGGSDGLEGDGPLFVRTLGIHAINGRLDSTEHVGRSPARMSDAQLEASARLKAWRFDRAQVPWSSFPLNPHTGCVTHLQHWEFATKPCPGAGIIGQTNALQNRIRALMKQAQEGESQQEIPPPEPIEPDHSKYPEGMDRNIAADRFGKIRLHRPGKRLGHFGFHEGHAVCEAWLERGSKDKAYPEGADWWQFSDEPGITRHVVTFINGWVLWRANAREGWRWM